MLDSDPGQRTTVLVALATIGVTPAKKQRGQGEERSSARHRIHRPGERRDGEQEEEASITMNANRRSQRKRYLLCVLCALCVRIVLRKPSKRQEEIEPRAAEGILGGGGGGVGVARAALGVDDLDVGRGAGAEADVDDVHHLLRLVGGGPGAREAALGRSPRPRAPRAPGTRRGARASVRFACATSSAAWRCTVWAARVPLSKIGTRACSSNRQLFDAVKNCPG